MKKVGLITIHKNRNFGSVLQAYALQHTIRNLGYDCQIIDYCYPNEYHKNKYKKKKQHEARNANTKLSFCEKWRFRIYSRSIGKFDANLKKYRYNRYIQRNLNISECYSDMESLHECEGKYDIYVTGSDQVWNPRYLFDDVSFLLPFTDSKNKVAFSASFGTTDIPIKYKELYQPLLKKYNNISTREQSGVKLVHEICSRKAQCTCDPTLLLTGDDWRKFVPLQPKIKGKYILCYVLTYTSDPYPYAYELIKYIKKELGYKVVCIDDPSKYWLNSKFRNLNACGPIEMLNLFSNASFIISSSFHGTAFSVNFKKDFLSILPPNINDDRQESFLKIIGAEDHIIKVGDPLPKPEKIKVKDWDNIMNRLNAYRRDSMKYLVNSLEDCAND